MIYDHEAIHRAYPTNKLTVHDEYEKREKAFHEQQVHSVMDKHDELESKVKDSPKIISRKGNVIKVDWGQV